MTKKYITSNILSGNPLILDLARDYNELKQWYESKNKEMGPSILKSCEEVFTLENAWLIMADEIDD